MTDWIVVCPMPVLEGSEVMRERVDVAAWFIDDLESHGATVVAVNRPDEVRRAVLPSVLLVPGWEYDLWAVVTVCVADLLGCELVAADGAEPFTSLPEVLGRFERWMHDAADPC